ncbi:MAG: hypothetical protein L6N96_00010 [Candidatus Methylarchaceae archaeon HK02M2]|nr:hypothetical protein [Candidatus Methylarchaceae archaeon HK02M2]
MAFITAFTRSPDFKPRSLTTFFEIMAVTMVGALISTFTVAVITRRWVEISTV